MSWIALNTFCWQYTSLDLCSHSCFTLSWFCYCETTHQIPQISVPQTAGTLSINSVTTWLPLPASFYLSIISFSSYCKKSWFITAIDWCISYPQYASASSTPFTYSLAWDPFHTWMPINLWIPCTQLIWIHMATARVPRFQHVFPSLSGYRYAS